jgi:hypothetical protein
MSLLLPLRLLLRLQIKATSARARHQGVMPLRLALQPCCQLLLLLLLPVLCMFMLLHQRCVQPLLVEGSLHSSCCVPLQ